MAISFNNLVSNSRTIVIDINGEDLTLTYNPSKLSPASMNKFTDTLDEEDSYAMARLFCEIVTDWDFEGPMGEGDTEVKAGERIPIDADHVAWLPAPYLKYIVEQIGLDGPKSKKGSRR